MPTPTDRKTEYNNEPVFYCTRCLSLLIRDIPGMSDTEYCAKCNSVNIEQCSIEDWEEKYRNRYGHSYLKEDKSFKYYKNGRERNY